MTGRTEENFMVAGITPQMDAIHGPVQVSYETWMTLIELIIIHLKISWFESKKIYKLNNMI